MLTRMEIEYRSKAPCNKKPAIFTTGGYSVKVGDRELNFDFQDMESYINIKNGFLHITAIQKNFEESLLDGFTMAEVDSILRKANKADFTEIFYECFADENETELILLKPMSITFFDFSDEGDGAPIEVAGDVFVNLAAFDEQAFASWVKK